MRRFLMAAALVIGCCSATLADDVETQPYWIKFKVGSWVRTKTTTKMDMPQMKMETLTLTTTTLVEVTDSELTFEYAIESTTIMNGAETKSPPSKANQKMPRKVKRPETTEQPASAAKTETGTEEIEVGGKKIKCTWSTFASEASGMKTSGKAWICEDVPSAMVKSESKTEGAANTESTMVAEAWEAK